MRAKSLTILLLVPDAAMDPEDDAELVSNGGGDGGFIGDDFSGEFPDEEEVAPLPPESIAASFEVDEESTPDLTEDDTGTDSHIIQGHVDAVVMVFQGHDDEGGGWEDDEDDERAPAPPEMMAASYEQSIGNTDQEMEKGPPNNTDAQIPAKHNAAVSFQGHDYDDRKLEDDEDDEEAPPPSEMTAASYELVGNIIEREKARNLPESIDDDASVENPTPPHSSNHTEWSYLNYISYSSEC